MQTIRPSPAKEAGSEAREVKPAMRSNRFTAVVVLIVAFLASELGLRSIVFSYVRALLLVADAFPSVRFKPLLRFTRPPDHHYLRLESEHGPVVADLFLPSRRQGAIRPQSMSAVILSMGVKTQEKGKRILLRFAATMSRLGYVAIWPRLERMDRGACLLEQPSTFLAAYRHVEAIEMVDPTRISFVGFSVGSSIAFVTAADDEIVDKVRSVVFFGGFYDAVEYLVMVATGTTGCSGRPEEWHPHEGAPGHIREILEEAGAKHLLRIFSAGSWAEAQEIIRSAPEQELIGLRSASPSERIDKFRARVFILHDKADRYVPYAEALRLNEVLAPRVQTTMLIANLFEHVQPGRAITREAAADFARLLRFLATALRYL